ncbi:non-ribosomal peptide synthetase [Streptomyces megasporus]|uniref:non-ribosomal peptide synthetase n=1 Tax=Streptomyces megasporus TaxID=44060 RepID=UPI00068CA52B|nr:non-ribosomal peptide synthetase [Streptomyces megasporus]
MTGPAEHPASGGGLAELIAERARETPDAPALRCGEAVLGYRELDERAEALAARLRRAGVGPEVPVGVLLRRSVELAVALLGVLKAGGACVPLDPDYPRQRLAFVLQDVAAPVLLTARALAGSLPAHSSTVLLVDDGRDEDAAADRAAHPAPVHPDNLAWVAYTSGSTGRPKGVLLTHGPLANLARGIGARLDLTPEDRVLQFASIGFSVAAEEILSTWVAGACLVMDPEEELADSGRLLALIEREEVTVLQLTPSYWYEWMRELGDEDAPTAPASLRLLVVGSEPVAVDRVAAWCATKVRLVQEYGATEATVSQLLYETDADADEIRGLPRLPIGTPLPGLWAYVLDERLAPVPDGEPGELYLGGEGVSRGYLGLPAMTAERFLPDPFAGRPGARMYRTRDLARRLPGGELEFLGRVDHQINIRGIRIEPGEVETAIGRFPGVLGSAVLARADSAGTERLVAYVVWDARPRARALRAFLRGVLPPALVPSRYVPLPALPLSPNGKVDRRALGGLPLDEGARGRTPAVGPRTPLEERLLPVWQEVLGGEPIGVEDDFFELGGDSLGAVRLAAELRSRLDLDVRQRMIFRAPTVAALAAELERTEGAGDSGPRSDGAGGPEDRAPASFAQRQMWLLHRMAPTSPRFNEPVLIRLIGEPDPVALRRALDGLVDRHRALRTVFTVEEGLPVQSPMEPREFALPLVDVEGRDADGVRAAVAELARRPFDLTRGPLLRAALLRCGPREHLLVLVFHHIVFDGGSMEVLFDELGEAYRAALAGEEADLPELPLQYTDYARWQHRQAAEQGFDEQLAYWRKRLMGAPAKTRLPFPLRPAQRTGKGAVLRFAVSPALTARLHEVAGAEHATVFMVLLAAFYEQVHRATGARDLVVGTLVSGRDRPELAGLVGLFVNSLCLRTELADGARFHELLAAVREEVRDGLAHQDVPFERVVEELRPVRSAQYNPLFQLLFSYGSTPSRAPRMPGLRTALLPCDTGTSKFDATLALDDDGAGGLRGQLEYDSELFDEPSARRVVDDYLAVLDAVAADPGHAVSGS